MSAKQILNSKHFRMTAIVVGVLLVALVSFGVGVSVGSHKAQFSKQWGQNYERNVVRGPEGKGGDDRAKFFGKMEGKGMRNGHGMAGEIISISGDTLIIKNPENQENTIRVNENTIINRERMTIAFTDLKTGERVVVIGKPETDGVIAARLLRVFPTPSEEIQ